MEELSDRLRKAATETESLGQLSEESVRVIREAGVMRLLQPVEYGGYAAHPRDFAEAVMAVSKACGASGWVCGVGGVHPWEMGLMDARLQQEVWGQNQDTWIASPYAPCGVAVPVDGGYRLSGRWPFSSGTDHCDWVFLGALAGATDGKPLQPTKMLHVVLPRSDYDIDAASWNVMGLSGTGSKDVVVNNAFIPGYRTIEAADVIAGQIAADRAQRTEPVYRLPFWTIFPLGITSSVIGICEGLLDAHLDYQRERSGITGRKIKEDPYNLYAISEAASDIAASRTQLIAGISRIYDKIEAGQTITAEDRAVVRRDQVRCAWRAVNAVDQIFARSGGNAVRDTNSLQRQWRDAHVGLQHAIHVPGEVYHATALLQMGVEPDPILGSLY